MKLNRLWLALASLALGVAMVGCASEEAWQLPAPAPVGDSPTVTEAKQFRPGSAAGVPVPENPAGPMMWASLVTSRQFSARPDSFALQPKERAYERSQTIERVFGDMGGFTVEFTPAEEKIVVPQVEPQPYRRLAGVIVGDSVMALIDMGDGKLTLISPGQKVGEWTVVSIDSEKAVLRRGGNKLPHEVTARLESPPPAGMGVGGGGGAGQGGGSDDGGG